MTDKRYTAPEEEYTEVAEKPLAPVPAAQEPTEELDQQELESKVNAIARELMEILEKSE